MESILKRIIADFHQRPYPDLKTRLKQVSLDIEKIITIIGPRRAGKTCFLFQLMKELEHRGVERKRIIYLDFEDERLERPAAMTASSTPTFRCIPLPISLNAICFSTKSRNCPAGRNSFVGCTTHIPATFS